MRLERLEVHGFGAVSDRRLEFAPGLNVLLGGNEAGKSTIHRAVRAALYGVDAGGQGRPTSRSEWKRWLPWDGDIYGVSLTYALSDGRRFRVARSLERRGQTAQVWELGGGDVTERLRAGRAVTPGQVHLGLEEAVFAATACLSEEGLRVDAPDAAPQHAGRLREAIERLADSASESTASEAVARLREAEARLGSERQRSSPLGSAVLRVRELDRELEAARERTARIATEQDRLSVLEAEALVADRCRLDRERAWLVGRLATIAATQHRIGALRHEERELERLISATQPRANFPVDREARVMALGGELGQARAQARAEVERARDQEGRAAAAGARLEEIGTALRTLSRAPVATASDLAECDRLAGDLAAEERLERRHGALRATEARCDALRREIATTGLGSVPVGDAEPVARLVEAARRGEDRRQRARPVALLIGALGAAAAATATAGGRPVVVACAGALALLAIAATLVAAAGGGGRAAAARRELARRHPGLELSPAMLDRVAARLPALRALHESLLHERARADVARSDLDAGLERAEQLSTSCAALAKRLGVEVTIPPGIGPGPLPRARLALAAVRTAGETLQRRHDLEEESQRLAEVVAAALAQRERAAALAEAVARLERELDDHLVAAGLPAAGTGTGRAVAAFRAGCSAHRRHLAARDRLDDLRRSLGALGAADAESLEREAGILRQRLTDRGGDAGEVTGATPLTPHELGRLEDEVETARRQATALSRQAETLRAHLVGVLDGLPAIADLEDERAACEQVRQRCLHQLAGLRLATDRIADAARRVHRDVAPRLADAITARLGLLTAGRYLDANVDAEHFAVSLRAPGRPELIPLEVLSRGTREQVALLLRIALAEVLGADREPVPLLLDDPLLSADPGRRRAAVEFLLGLSRTTQVLITTSDPDVAEQVVRSDVGATVRVTQLDAPGAAAAGAAVVSPGPAARLSRPR